MSRNDITDKHKTYLDQTGQKATVHRETVSAEKSERLNRMLCDLGLASAELDPALQHYTYLGSAAVHIWAAPTIDSQIYIPQAGPLALYRCPMPIANTAFLDLEKAIKTLYGMRSGKKRSGL